MSGSPSLKDDREEMRSLGSAILHSNGYLRSTTKQYSHILSTTRMKKRYRVSRIGDEASWKCAIAKRRESFRMECRGWQRRGCRYVEKRRYRKRRERERKERGRRNA